MSATGLTFFRADRLREARQALGLTQAELAEKIDVKRWSVHQWEAGNRRPQANNFAPLLEALGVEGEFLAPLPPDPTLVQIRQQKGYTQLAWADLLGVEPGKVANVETGRQYPSDVERFAECWGLSVNEFADAWERSRRNAPRV